MFWNCVYTIEMLPPVCYAPLNACISTLSLYLVQRYLRQVQDEVLRLSTLAPYAARFSEDDITVGGYPIPAMVRMGTPCMLEIFAWGMGPFS